MYSFETAVVLLAVGLASQASATPLAARAPASRDLATIFARRAEPLHIVQEIPLEDGAKLLLYGPTTTTTKPAIKSTNDTDTPPPPRPTVQLPPWDLCHRGPLGCTGLPGPTPSTCRGFVNDLKTFLSNGGTGGPGQMLGICKADREGWCCSSWKTTGENRAIRYADLIATTEAIVDACVEHGSGGWASDVVAQDGGCLTNCISDDDYCGWD